MECEQDLDSCVDAGDKHLLIVIQNTHQAYLPLSTLCNLT